jgi:hypothetical protein
MKFLVLALGPALLGLAFASTAFADSTELGCRRARERSKIKRFGVCTVLSIAALFALLSFSPGKAYADALLNMELTGIQGAGYEGEAVYPYYGTANGNSVLLMCISFTNDMNLEETWLAEKQSIPDSSTFEEAVWLFIDANTAVADYNAATAAANAATALATADAKAGDTTDAAAETAIAASYSAIAAVDTAQQIADQWAAWELFSQAAYTNPAPGADTQMAAAVAAVANPAYGAASVDQGFILYAPVAGSQSELGTPQFFLGYGDQTPSTTTDPYGGTPTTPAYGELPEPSSLILLGSGMFSLLGTLYRKRRSA